MFGGLFLLYLVYFIFLKTRIDLNHYTPEKLQEVAHISIKGEFSEVLVKGTNYTEEGFSLNVPRGNSSACVWTWATGTGYIPGSETTNSTSGEANFHKLVTNFFNGTDFKVGCTNDYGEYFQGKFVDEPS